MYVIINAKSIYTLVYAYTDHDYYEGVINSCLINGIIYYNNIVYSRRPVNLFWNYRIT